MSSGPNIPNLNQSNLAKFAFNIYGTLSQSQSFESDASPSPKSTSRSKFTNTFKDEKLVYNCEKEVTCISQLQHPLTLNNTNEQYSSNHVIIGGKNYLKLLSLNKDYTQIVQELNVLDLNTSFYAKSRFPSTGKLNNINTLKSQKDTIACGLSNGQVALYKISNNGKSHLIQKYADHKRCINSLDFVDGYDQSNILISGSQDGSIKLWDLRSNSVKPMSTVLPSSHSDPIRSTQYSEHSTVRNKLTILSVHDSGSLCKHDLRMPLASNHMKLYTPERKWTYHTGPALSLHIHPEKEYVITGGRDQKLCIWNYGESLMNRYKNTPESIINTYGPVMKVRWSPYPVRYEYGDNIDHNEYSRIEERLTYDEREMHFSSPSNNPLYNYDFACLYLNEDPTITIYNIKRKYIPREVITTLSGKPFQNFIWAKSSSQTRRLWTISKQNIFSAFNIDSDHYVNVSKPLDNLSTVSVSWNAQAGSMSFVNQEINEFEVGTNNFYTYENGFNEENDVDSNTNTLTEFASDFSTPLESTHIEGNVYNEKNSSQSKISSSNDKISFMRPSTFKHGITSTSSTPPSRLGEFLPNNNNGLVRPSISRNPSQSTQESGIQQISPIGQAQHAVKKNIAITYPSPYIIPVNIPVPCLDIDVFKYLSESYLISLPEGFNLSEVCLINADIAANVNKFRDCQVWRLISASLPDEKGYEFETRSSISLSEEELNDADEFEESRSIQSDLNFIGSYNSNSTLTTNYGSLGENIASSDSIDKPDGNGRSRTHSLNEGRVLPTGSLKETLVHSRGASFNENSLQARNSLRIKLKSSDDNENAIVDSEEIVDSNSKLSKNDVEEKKCNGKPITNKILEPIKILDKKGFSFDDSKKEMTAIDLTNLNPISRSLQHKRSSQFNSAIEDLDNENMNILNNATFGSVSSSSTHFVEGSPNYFSQSHSNYSTNPLFIPLSRRNSAIGQDFGFTRYSKRHSISAYPKKIEGRNHLNDVQEHEEQKSTISGKKSQLTTAIEKQNSSKLFKAWETQNLVQEALDYASLQGDVVMCTTLTLLFYNILDLPKITCLEWISIYLDILRRERLFTTASNILKLIPKDLQSEDLVSKDLNLRFYCSSCNNLIVNENSKEKSYEFGYWYCDQCQTKQLNCIYCNEPCNGLNLIVSLKCGHRGHFGCLKEWFIEDANVECPSGCDYSIL